MIITLRAFISIGQQLENVLIEIDYFLPRYALGRFCCEPIDITDR